MVDLVGIEPTTSSMPWKRAPKLRHRPTCCRDATFPFSLLERDTSMRAVRREKNRCEASQNHGNALSKTLIMVQEHFRSCCRGKRIQLLIDTSLAGSQIILRIRLSRRKLGRLLFN